MGVQHTDCPTETYQYLVGDSSHRSTTAPTRRLGWRNYWSRIFIRENDRPGYVFCGDHLDWIEKFSTSDSLKARASTNSACPFVGVTCTRVIPATPLGSFTILMKPDTNLLAGTMTIFSALLDKDSRTKLASTSFALHDLLRPSLKPKCSS